MTVSRNWLWIRWILSATKSIIKQINFRTAFSLDDDHDGGRISLNYRKSSALLNFNTTHQNAPCVLSRGMVPACGTLITNAIIISESDLPFHSGQFRFSHRSPPSSSSSSCWNLKQVANLLDLFQLSCFSFCVSLRESGSGRLEFSFELINCIPGMYVVTLNLEGHFRHCQASHCRQVLRWMSRQMTGRVMEWWDSMRKMDNSKQMFRMRGINYQHAVV